MNGMSVNWNKEQNKKNLFVAVIVLLLGAYSANINCYDKSCINKSDDCFADGSIGILFTRLKYGFMHW